MISSPEDYDAQLRKLAEVGAELCTYTPGAGDPDRWPDATCDCKFLPLQHMVFGSVVITRRMTSENTGCCEVRQAYRVLRTLQEIARNA